MPRRRPRPLRRMRARLLAAAALALAAAGCRAQPETGGPRPGLALMTSLPIYWGEAEDFQGLLASDAGAGWVRRALEAEYALHPLDTLEPAALAGHRLLLLAQPRPLSPGENVALDEWVRGGGRVLIFADPLLTAHSHYPVGDKRRHQDVALLSPILARWGLELEFDEAATARQRSVTIAGTELPVGLAGRLRARTGSGCELAGQGVIARCAVGRGRATVFADAAVLEESEGEHGTAHGDALQVLLAQAFD
jgi:hypothetical protein